MALLDAVADPPVAHVERFGVFLAKVGGEDAAGGGVVGGDSGAIFGLEVFELEKSGDDLDGMLGVHEDTAGFGFGCGGDDIFEGLAEDVDDAVEFGSLAWRAFVAEVENAGGAASGFGEDEVGGIGFNVEDHVAGVVADFGLGVRG